MQDYGDTMAPEGTDTEKPQDETIQQPKVEPIQQPKVEMEIAADGIPCPGSVMTGSDFIQQIEDGYFSQDMHQALNRITVALEDHSQISGDKVSAELTMKFKFTKQDGHITVAASMSEKLPTLPRPKTVMWADQHNNLSRFPQQQAQLFGVVPGAGNRGPIRRV